MQVITFDGTSLGNITSYSVTYNKLWSSDSGRTLTGSYKGTLVGIFPKLSITFKPKTNDDCKKILQIVNKDFCKIMFYSPYHGEMTTQTFYFGDVSDEIKKAVGSSADKIKHGEIQVEAVAIKKM